MEIDGRNHDYVIEELDDQTLVVIEKKLAELKMRLEDVSFRLLCGGLFGCGG